MVSKKLNKGKNDMQLTKIKPLQPTLQEVFDEFMAFKEATQLSPKTLRDYYLHCNAFIYESHNSLDEQLLKADILKYFSAIPPTSPARFNHPYQYLSTFFNWCVEQEILSKNPFTALGIKKKKDDGNVKPASIEDIKTLLNSWDKTFYTGLRNYNITLLLIDTGIRTSELVQLRHKDFDKDSRQIIITKNISKSRRQRMVYLSQQTANSINQFIKVKPEEWEDWLFPSREGNQLNTHNLAREFNNACKKLGIKITPYQLRHTFATYFIENGGDVFTLQDLMGHSELRSTRRYTEINSVQKRKAHEAFSPLNEFKPTKRATKIK